MATMKRRGTSAPDPGPTIFVLFGATGDLAKRMVLPAFYRLALEGLLPEQWLLVGNGRGDVAHEDFRAHVHSVLTEFGPKPEPKDWDGFAERLWFAGGGFNTDSPGSLLDMLAKGRQHLGGDPQLVHYLAVPPVAFTDLTKALGQHDLAKDARVVYEKPFGTSAQAFRALRPGRALGARRAAGVPDRSLPGQGSDAGSARAALRQRTVRRDVEPRAGHRVGAGRRRAGAARHHRPVGVLRRHGRGALDMLVTHLFQGDRRGRDGAR